MLQQAVCAVLELTRQDGDQELAVEVADRARRLTEVEEERPREHGQGACGRCQGFHDAND